MTGLLIAWLLTAPGPSDPVALLNRCVPNPDETPRLRAAVGRLGDRSFAVRERASRELTEAGPRALAVLRPACNDPDPEVRQRARILTAEAARTLAGIPDLVDAIKATRPPGASAALLGVLPTTDEETGDVVLSGLLVVARSPGGFDAALASALRDPEPTRRAAAAFVLARYGGPIPRALVRPLRDDPHPRVRLYAVLGLLFVGERSHLPILVRLCADRDPAVAARATQALRALAGCDVAEKAPNRRRAWEEWVAAHGATVDLGRLAEDLPGQNFDAQARAVAKEFSDAWQSGNVAVMRASTAAPFALAGSRLDNLPALHASFTSSTTGRTPHFLVHRVAAPAEFVRRPEGESERAFLDGLKGPVRIVYYSPTPSSWGAIFVRRVDGRPKVVGITSDKSSPLPPP